MSKIDIDSGLFTDNPCKAPCWQNLTPGQSTADDVNQFLKDLSTSEWPEREVIKYVTGCQWIQITNKPGSEVDAELDLYIDNGILTYVRSIPRNRSRLGQFVDRIGTPEYISAILSISPEGNSYFLEVYYPKSGLAFRVLPDQKDTGYIKPDMPVLDVEYFPSGDLQSYLTVKYSCNLGQERATLSAQTRIQKYIQPWTGFGEVNVIESR
jgi:hypothetical protein